MNIKYLIFTILLIVFQVDKILGQVCNTYVDAASATTENCGPQASPCPTLIQSITACNKFNEININITPGQYAIDQQGTFGSVTNKTISIVNSGATPVVIDLKLSSEPFINVVATSNFDVSIITLTGITFQNGNQTLGSVINVTASWVNVQINQCNFIGNSATNSGGSFSFSSSKSFESVLNSNSTVTIIQSTFSSVKLNKIYGGVIYNSMDSILFKIDQSIFTNVTNTVSGGIGYFTNGYMTMTNTVISGCTSAATFFLGSYSLSSRNEPLFIFQNVNFTQSIAGVGFGIVSQSSLTTFSNCNFHDNSNTTIMLGYNGALTILDQCNFINNINKSPSGSGGAIKLYSTALLVKNSKFINNFAQVGGAIYVNGSDLVIYSSSVIIQNTLFSNNSANIGGAIAVDYNTVSLLNVVFNSNTASTLTSGSSIFCYGNSDIETTNCTFTNVQTSKKYNSLGLDCNGDNCNFQDSTTKKYYQCEVDNSPSKGGLTGLQKAGIAFAVIIGFIIVVVVIIVVLRRHKRHRSYKPIGL